MSKILEGKINNILKKIGNIISENKKLKVENKFERIQFLPKYVKLTIIIILFFTPFILNYTNVFGNFKEIRFIICNTPNHKNYGDEAILMATKEFLKDYFPKYKQIEIYSYESINNMKLIKRIINKNDIIIINGGGYFGLYKIIIEGEANIVKYFPNNHIIFFPCSILYNSQNFSEYNKYIDIFNEHKNLTLFTRDNKSYNIALNIFKNIAIYNSPDIVTRLNLKFLEKTKNRDGIMLILRKDELLLNDDNRKYIMDLAIKYFSSQVIERDSNNFSIPFLSNRKKETLKFINDISKKKLIITDRLHGMIFSIITNTPCIIFGNNYHKIESSYYSWFKNVENAIFIDKNEIGIKLETSINKLMNLKNFKKYDNRIFNKYYLLLKKIIQEKINSII